MKSFDDINSVDILGTTVQVADMKDLFHMEHTYYLIFVKNVVAKWTR